MNPASVPELRDIHLPPAPGWWPPAPGWWLLALALLIALVFVSRWLWRRERQRRWRRRVRAELERIVATHAHSADPLRAATDLSRLLRRATLLLDPRAAALRGEDWLDFLDARLPAGNTTFRADGKALVDAPFRRPGDAGVAVDVATLIALARRWLVHALREAPAHA
jgi:hypothetical protein